MNKKLHAMVSIITLLVASCAKNESVTYYQPRTSVDSSHATLSQIMEYKPAPGQNVNTTAYGGQSKALAMAYDSTFKNMITLGAWGGSITFKFDHSVENLEGADIAIYANPFSGFDEPGIVMVSQDLNNNGIADDIWYELGGSQYDSSTTIHNYQVTYYNPNANVDVPWKDNQGNSGVINNINKSRSFYPLESFSADYTKYKDSIVFEGARLRSLPLTTGIIYNNVAKLGWWGYSDTYTAGAGPESMDNYAKNQYNSFDIEWARNNDGKTIKLQYIDFVKVYTGQLSNAGILGEISTEFKGAKDLHISKL